MLICLHSAHGFFGLWLLLVELGSRNQRSIACKAKNIYCLALYGGKKGPTSRLGPHDSKSGLQSSSGTGSLLEMWNLETLLSH